MKAASVTLSRSTLCDAGRAVELLSECQLFRGFSDDELHAFIHKLNPLMQNYTKGDIITRIGDPITLPALLISGTVAERRPVHCSASYVLARHKPGAVLGLEARFSGPGRSPVECVCETDCELLYFNYSALFKPDRLTENLALALANNSIRKTLKLGVLAAPTLRGQIMTFFQAMRDKFDSDTFTVRMTQGEMAKYLCTSRSYLSRELNDMQREGILQILPNGSYRVMKWKTDPPVKRAHRSNSKTNMDK